MGKNFTNQRKYLCFIIFRFTIDKKYAMMHVQYVDTHETERLLITLRVTFLRCAIIT